MSAVYGVICIDGGDPQPTMNRLASTLQDIPCDHIDTYVNGPVSLGEKTVWNTPESQASGGPYEAGELVVVGDIRIDNHSTMAEWLGLEPLAPDGIVFAHAWQRWERGALNRLLGDWAVAVWDRSSNQLALCRDHMGVRPLYWTARPGRYVAFASRVSDLLALPSTPTDLNETVLAECLIPSTTGIPDDATPYRAIHRVPAGGIVAIRANGTSTDTRYWQPGCGISPISGSHDELAAGLCQRLTEAVECRTRSAWRVAADVSGGLDSTFIAAHAAATLARSGGRLVTFFAEPAATPDDTFVGDDKRYADLFVDTVDTDHHWVHLIANPDLHRIKTGSPWPMRPNLYRDERWDVAATTDVRTILSGYGGDECATFNGRGTGAWLLLHGQWRRLVAEATAWRRNGHGSAAGWIVGQVGRHLVPDWRTRHRRAQAVAQFVHDDFVARTGLRRHTPPSYNGADPDQTRLRWLTFGHIQRINEAWAHGAMGAGVEWRFPLLDRRVIDYCLAIPAHRWIDRGWTRALYRSAVAGLMPEVIRLRPHKGDPSIPQFHIAACQRRMNERVRILADDPTVRHYLKLDHIGTETPIPPAIRLIAEFLADTP